MILFHVVFASVLVAASTHHLIFARGYLAGRFQRVRQEKLFAAVAAAAYALAFAIGLLMYPRYKLVVRVGYLDPRLPWVARLFDIKEMWMLVGVALAGGLFYLSRRAHPSEDRRVAPLYLGLSALLCLSSWGAALMGLLVATYKR